jgi:hypothetical protein
VGKTKKRRPLGRPRRKWENNIKMKCDRSIYLIDLAQDMDRWLAFVNAVMNLQFLSNANNL